MPGKFEAPRNGGRPGRPGSGGNPPDRSGNGGSSARRPRPRRRRRRIGPLVLLPLVLVLVLLVVLLTRCGRAKDPEPQDSRLQITDAAETTLPQPTVVATATVAAQGDLLMHKYIFTDNPKYPGACNLGDGVYNFDSIFKYVTPYISAADYAVANLETTLGGDGYPYSGNPLFNCPDALADSAANAGFDMLLTANNHCADTTADGLKRTVEQVRSRNLATLGTQLNDQEKKYALVDVNGIRIGMLCYTYAAGLESDGSPNLNFKDQTIVREAGVVNYFTVNNLDRLYSEVQTILSDMKAEGAEASMLFIHWGTEYELTQDATQSAIAQKMCDLGIDVIVGGHPHVVEPMDLLTSNADPDHKTVCIYSLGNAVSNQRREEMRLDTGHTEDGALFSVTFEKNSDGAVRVSDVNVMPTWVNKFVNGDGKFEYNILPLDGNTRDQWKTRYGLSDAAGAELQASYDRTMAIVGPGLSKCRDFLGSSEETA
ncbi:CapA family protein [bacterium]|nr:CapA family protein [bacterium]